MSIEKITSKIVGDAEEKKKAVLAEAKAKADEILAAARKEADDFVSSETARGRQMKETLIERHGSVAAIDCRKLVLRQKQELLEDCFAQAVQALSQLPEEEYVDFLVALGKAAGEKEGALIFNERDKAAVGAKVCEKLSAAAGGTFVVAEETRAIAGGFFLQAGKVFINNTVEALVAEHKEAMNSEVAGKLFE
ncbi:MAG: V-type ATP synthase subunit E [Firmicutes bacterium]|nr:V-type ATP synthase subunit E [Bacillota bacterium]